MGILELCSRKVAYIDGQAGIVEVARIMREQHVGSVVVVDERGAPCGIVTDRDLVVEVLAMEADTGSLRVADIMSPNPVTVSEDMDMDDALASMRMAGVRRAPVVDDEGLLSGLVSVDDMLVQMSSELNDIICLTYQQQLKECDALFA